MDNKIQSGESQMCFKPTLCKRFAHFSEEERVSVQLRLLAQGENMLSILRAQNTKTWKQLTEFVNTYHSYIKWSDRPSRKMYWALYEDENLVGCFGLGSAFSRPKIIQDFMKENNILFNELGNNIVYCLYGCSTKNSGTQFLKLIRNDAKIWWNERYGDTLKALQTFILPPRNGAMYKADNWSQLGETTGGVSQIVRTIQKKDLDKYDASKIEKRIFKSGEVKYLYRDFVETEKKLIFVKLLR